VNETQFPTNLLEATRYFADQDVCVQFVASLRWPDGPVCPTCGGRDHSYLTTRRVWKCKNKDCRRQFSVKVGSIFEDSAIPLDKWLVSIWLIANSKNGISSYELHRAIGITQKSAWFVLHRVRLAMQTRSWLRQDGIVEADETYVGGKAGNMHKRVKANKKRDNTGKVAKTVVAVTLERGTDDKPSQVNAQVLQNDSVHSIRAHVRTRVAQGATLYTDGHAAYGGLKHEFSHAEVNHIDEYVRGQVHTNGIENFWALLKRGIHGTYVQIAPEHVSRYVDERVFTFNNRDLTDFGRFALVLHRVAGRRLTYAKLTRA
jgi:transposase-like protein